MTSHLIFTLSSANMCNVGMLYFIKLCCANGVARNYRCREYLREELECLSLTQW
jgi:hypothetical protein